VPLIGGFGHMVASPILATGCDGVAVTGQSLLAASGQILMSAHRPRDSNPRPSPWQGDRAGAFQRPFVLMGYCAASVLLLPGTGFGHKGADGGHPYQPVPGRPTRWSPVMPASRYRKKPLVQYEHGTRVYAPSPGELRYRVVATDPVSGERIFAKCRSEDGARAKARELEGFIAQAAPIRDPADAGPRTVARLAARYIDDHLYGLSVRFREMQ
jgi:hypothetical protein